jgi:hypothetical protein
MVFMSKRDGAPRAEGEEVLRTRTDAEFREGPAGAQPSVQREMSLPSCDENENSTPLLDNSPPLTVAVKLYP